MSKRFLVDFLDGRPEELQKDLYSIKEGTASVIVLGIETSCDETAAAVVTANREILSNVILSQAESHQPYGGVVPEIAARSHLEYADSVVAQAMAEARIEFCDLSGVAVTAGPGLIGGLLVGVMTAKSIALVQDIPFLAVNHLQGHALTVRLADKIHFPYLLLLVSGGHCQLLAVEDVGRFRRLGTTMDDALGEAFDKVAKMLDLGYPGGPAVEKAAESGDPTRFKLPRPMRGKPGCHFSFSGLKTAVRQTANALPPGPFAQTDVADLCASFQAAAADVLIDRCANALEAFRAQNPNSRTLAVAGGVAANRYLRARLGELDADITAPPLDLCTDNGAMIAWAGLERLRQGETDGLDFKPRPRWPLDPNAPPAAYAGVKA